MQQIRAAYRVESKKHRSLDEAVHSEIGGALKTLLMARVRDKQEFYARELYKTLKGVGSSVSYMEQICVLQSPTELQQINQVYEQANGKDFIAHLRGEAISAAGYSVPFISRRFGRSEEEEEL